MFGFKHLLPSSTFRATVCVSVAVGTSLSGLGDEVEGCLAGLARVPADLSFDVDAERVSAATSTNCGSGHVGPCRIMSLCLIQRMDVSIGKSQAGVGCVLCPPDHSACGNGKGDGSVSEGWNDFWRSLQVD